MPTAAVDAVLFDLDGTLCRFVQSSETLLADSFEAVGVEPFFTIGEYQERYSDYLDPDESVEDLRANCFADLAADRGLDPAIGRELAAAYSSQRDYTVEPLPGAASVLAHLDEAYVLGLVSNGRPSLQEPKLKSLEFSDRFDAVVFGGHNARPKPSPEPFELALERLAVSPERTVHVGNSLTTDVAGARAAGVRAVWLRDGERASPDPEPDFSIEAIEHLVPPPW